MRNERTTCGLRATYWTAGVFIFVLTVFVPWTALAQKPQNGRLGLERVDSRLNTFGGEDGCTDGDDDGYGSGTDCLGPDCDDADADVNPGETELCNGKDDNCDGNRDEGFTVLAPDGTAHCNEGANHRALCKVAADCPGGQCLGDAGTFLQFGMLPLGRQCAAGLGPCTRIGEVVCRADGAAAVCNAVAGPPDPAGEGRDEEGNIDPTAASCFDRVDNDCDGIVDHGGVDEEGNRVDNPNCKTAELCDGFDNDNDGAIDEAFVLGVPCSVGVGSCVNSGVVICKSDGSAGCNVSPLTPGVENTPGGARCLDGKDNDCDGKIDLTDAGCQTEEKCDGKDNDGDGASDEDFPLGEACETGVGACRASGVRVCSADQRGTICTAVPKQPTAEIPVGTVCADDIDNDCDGLIDSADGNCNIQDLTVNCALLPAGRDADGCRDRDGSRGRGEECLRKHKVYFETAGADISDEVTAELLALDLSGAAVQTLPVQNGDTISLDHQMNAAIATSTEPAETDDTHAIFEGVRLGDIFTLVPASEKEKLPSAIYLHALRLPEGLLLETTKLPLNCSTPLWAGSHFGSFEIVRVESFKPPRGNQTCRGGVREIVLRYTGKLTHGAAGVDVIATTNKHLPRADHSVISSAPLLRVTLQTPTTTAQAYCAAIPFVRVVQPDGSVSNGDAGMATPVVAAIPNFDPSTLVVKVDGVDVLAALGIDPTRDLPGGPFDGQMLIGGETVLVDDLVVRSAPIDIPNANTVTMSLSNLACGGHSVVVEGDAVPRCEGRVTGLRLRYDGVGCEGSSHTQCARKFDCYGHAKFADPVRVKVMDRRHRVLVDTGMPASVHLGDTIEVLASAIDRRKLSCDTIVKVFTADNYLQEEVEFCTSCAEPLTVGYIFGSFRVTGMTTSPIRPEDDECDDGDNSDDLVVGPPGPKAAGRDPSPRSPGTLSAVDSSDAENEKRDSGPVCYVDDLSAAGSATVFRIDVTRPTEGQVTPGGATRVTGSVCHGLRIAEADINGFELDVGAQTVTPGDGVNSGDLYTLDFDVLVPVTNLRRAIAAGRGTGSFDPGSNLLVARAMDENFNTAFDTLTFAVGPVVPVPEFAPGGVARPAAAGPGDPPNFVQQAFVLGVNTTGISRVFTAQKDSNKRCMGDRVKRKLRDQRPPPKELDVADACNPDVTMTINGAEIQRDQSTNLELDFGINVDPNPNRIDVRIDVPPIDLRARFTGYCESGCVCAFGGCVCASCVTVDVNAILVRKNMKLTFAVSEERILQTGVPREERESLDFNFNTGESDPDDATRLSGKVDIGCALGVLLDIADFFVTVFTLGFVEVDLDILDFEIEGDDMKDRFDSLDGDPMELDFVKMKNDEESLNDFDSRQRDSRLTGCEITDGGMSIAVGSAFEPQEDKIDPEARPIPGTPLKNAPVPQPPIADFIGRAASDVTIAISDDVFNQLLYNMTQTGRLKTEFEHVREMRSFMPDDCDTITGDSRRARCIGWQTQDCSEFTPRTCSAESLNAGADCNVDLNCRLCVAGTPSAGTQCTTDASCGQVCSGANAGTLCTRDSQCTGTCSAGSPNQGDDCTRDFSCGRGCSGGDNDGDPCTADFQCPGGACVPGTCDGVGTCDAIAGACDSDGVCEAARLRRSCIIGKLIADRFNVRPETQLILRAKIDEAPKLLIDDDPACPPGAGVADPCRTAPVDVKLHVSNLTIAMIADRNNNSAVDGDEVTLAECDFSELNSNRILELEDAPPGTVASDCLLFRHCLRIDVNFSMGVETVGDRNRIKMDFGGIDRANTGGYQCGGTQSLPELDFFNREAGRDGSLDLLERDIRDNTPRVAPEGLDLGGNVRFTLDRILAIRTRPQATCGGGICSGGFNSGGSCSTNADCEDGFQDFIGLTGHSTATPGPNEGCPE